VNGAKDATLTLGAGGSEVLANGKIAMSSDVMTAGATLCGGTTAGLTNSGTIQTDAGAGGSRTLRGAIANQATLNVKTNTTVPASGSCGTNALTNAGGTINVDAGKTFSVAAAFTQTAGSVNGLVIINASPAFSPTGGSGTFRLNGDNQVGSDIGPDVTVAAQGTAAADATVRWSDALPHTNAGTVRLGSMSAAHPSRLRAGAGLLTNTGTIETLVAMGGVRELGGAIDNQGTLSIGVDTQSDPVAPLQLANHGALTIEGGRTFTPGVLTQSGGTLFVNGTLDYGVQTLTFDGGTVQGGGTITAGTVSNTGGTVHPENSPGVLTVNGDYTQGAGGTLDTNINGAINFGQLKVNGAASLAGTLRATTSLAPSIGDTFKVVDSSGARTGMFATTVFDAGTSYDVQYHPNDVTLVATAPPPPGNSTRPVVSGSPVVGEALGCSDGVWTGGPTGFMYEWNRDGVPIVGAATSAYVVADADKGHALTCTVTAMNAGGSTSATSDPLSVPADVVLPPAKPACTLAPLSRTILAARKRRKLSMSATCDQDVDVTLTGRLRVTKRGGGKAKGYSLGPAVGSAVAGAPRKFALRLPWRSLYQLRKKGSKAVAMLTLNATNANGQTTVPLTVRLKILR
jgi:hypothetical protein